MEQLGFWRKLARAPVVRRVLAAAGDGHDPRVAAARGARDAGPQPVGPGGHLRRAGGLPGDRAEGREQRQGVPGHGTVVSRPGDRRRQRAGCHPLRRGHRAVLPGAHPAAVPRSVSERRRAEGRCGAGHGVRDGHQHVAPIDRLAVRLHQRVLRAGDSVVPFGWPRARLRGAEGRRRRLRRLRVRPVEAGPLSAAAGRRVGRAGMVAVARERPARGVWAGRTSLRS